MNDNFRDIDRQKAVDWACELLGQSFMILDTESTGLGLDAEIVQIAVLNSDGKEWVNSLVKCRNPQKLLEKDPKKGTCAYDIHGIHPDHLLNAPEWDDIHADLWVSLCEERLIVFNLSYDWPLIQAAHDSRMLLMPKPRSTECAMLQYAQWYGEWNDYRGSYKWQPLPQAPGAKAHDAMGDCVSTLYLIKRMAGHI